MSADLMRVKQIFLAAVEKTNPQEREALLLQECGDDAALRQEVETLLSKHDRAGDFLAPPTCEPGTDDGSALEIDPLRFLGDVAGSQIGPYRLIQKLGEGGMGSVWVAEQSEPVKRRVALKLIKAGMDSEQIVRRLEAERQALALMDHPNIARILEAGSVGGSPSATGERAGRPYFVMELVKGVPITKYCDELQLSVRERLELFVQVCSAVQHAHTKGIIHRDVKPSNVLVSSHDGRPVVKVIDFGVAKAIGQQLTDKTVYTQFTQMIGTPLYMSPEQAGQSGLDVDTRSDIYSLGVLLYELLTGTTPLDKGRLHEAHYHEVPPP